MDFTLSIDNAIRGDQLADEINKGAAQSLTVFDLSFYAPRTVQIAKIASDPNGAIQAIVTAHVPQANYFQAEKDAATVKNAVVTVAQSAVGVRFDQLTAVQVRALMAIVLYKYGALKVDGTVKPLGQWD